MKYLGHVSNEPTRELDLVPAPAGITTVVLRSEEFTSHCPVTGQPDFASVIVEYGPDASIVETKSFKLFLWSFRSERAFNEQIACDIAGLFHSTVKPRWTRVIAKFHPRGGVSVEAVSYLEG